MKKMKLEGEENEAGEWWEGLSRGVVSDDLSDGVHLSRDLKEKRDRAGACRKGVPDRGNSMCKSIE